MRPALWALGNACALRFGLWALSSAFALRFGHCALRLALKDALKAARQHRFYIKLCQPGAKRFTAPPATNDVLDVDEACRRPSVSVALLRASFALCLLRPLRTYSAIDREPGVEEYVDMQRRSCRLAPGEGLPPREGFHAVFVIAAHMAPREAALALALA